MYIIYVISSYKGQGETQIDTNKHRETLIDTDGHSHIQKDTNNTYNTYRPLICRIFSTALIPGTRKSRFFTSISCCTVSSLSRSSSVRRRAAAKAWLKAIARVMVDLKFRPASVRSTVGSSDQEVAAGSIHCHDMVQFVTISYFM